MIEKNSKRSLSFGRRFKYASMGLTVLGVILISKPVIEYILKRIEDTLERRRRQFALKRYDAP
jgi:E3 ubiquitin-protein ligase MUL1